MNVIDDTVATRREAALALGRINDPQGYEALIEALFDPHQEVWHGARTALCQIGGREVEAELRDFQPRGFAAFAVKEKLRKLLTRS